MLAESLLGDECVSTETLRGEEDLGEGYSRTEANKGKDAEDGNRGALTVGQRLDNDFRR
jgi:hypothetical protein